MKRYKLLLLTFFAFLFLISCQDEEEFTGGILYDKPLSVIKSQIEGTWELHYGEGGISGSAIYNYDSIYWTFDFADEDRIQLVVRDTVVLDTTLIWYQDIGSYTEGKSTYIMKYYQGILPMDYIINGIHDDTLVLHHHASDAVFYYLTKHNP